MSYLGDVQDPEINELTLKWQNEEEKLVCVFITFTCLSSL